MLYLFRYLSTEDITRGILIEPSSSFLIHTLELPWRDNKNSVSCIPEGEYQVSYLAKSNSGKYRRVYHVRDVPDRAGILIHSGNTTRDTKGCILVGMKMGTLAGLPAILQSKIALQRLRNLLGTKSTTLRISG